MASTPPALAFSGGHLFGLKVEEDVPFLVSWDATCVVARGFARGLRGWRLVSPGRRPSGFVLGGC